MIKTSPLSAAEHDMPYPGGRWAWFGVACATPVFLLIGLSVYSGWPPQDDIVAWGFVLGLTAFSAVGKVLDIAAWKLREQCGRPPWWTVSRHENLGRALWMSGLAGFVLIPDEMRGWDGLRSGALTWALWFVPMFVFNEAADGIAALCSRRYGAAHSRRPDKGGSHG